MPPLTKDFRETVQSRARRDPEFRKALLQESVELMLEGDIETGKAHLRNYINATVGFETLAQVVGKSAKSLMRMFSFKGNPQAKNLFTIIAFLQKQEGIQFGLQLIH